MPSDAVSRVLTTVISDAELRAQLIAAPEAERKQIAQEAGLFDGITEEDEHELHRLSSNPEVLNEAMLERVTGGSTATEAGGADVSAELVPTSNMGGATDAGIAVADTMGAVTAGGEAVATVAVVASSLAVFLC